MTSRASRSLFKDTITIVGTCVVCDREIAVRPTKTAKLPTGMTDVPRWFGGAKPSHVLVHHGYKRPGIGCIVGDCFAVAMPPHELSPFTAERFQQFCTKMKADNVTHLAALHAGEVEVLYNDERVPVPTTAHRDMWAVKDPGWTRALVRYTSTETEPKRKEVFASLVRDAIAHTEQSIKFYGDEIVRMSQRLADWKPAELRERPEPVPDPSRRRRRFGARRSR